MKLVLKMHVLPMMTCALWRVYEDGAAVDPRMCESPNVQIRTLDCSGALVIPEGVDGILADAFADVPQLEEVCLPDSLRTWGFAALRPVPRIRIHPTNPTFRMENGFLIQRSFGGDRLVWVPGRQEVVWIPDSVREVAQDVFLCSRTLVSVRLPAWMEFMPREMFLSCSALRRVYLPRHLKSISERAFANCSALQAVVMENPSTFISHDPRGLSDDNDSFSGVRCILLFTAPNMWMQHYFRTRGFRCRPLDEADFLRQRDRGPDKDREADIRNYLASLPAQPFA